MSYLTLTEKDNKVTLHGVSQPKADIVLFNESYLVIKVPGHTSYNYYCPTEIQVYTVKRVKFIPEKDWIEVEADRILRWDAKQKVGDNKVKNMLEMSKDKLFFNHENKRVF